MKKKLISLSLAAMIAMSFTANFSFADEINIYKSYMKGYADASFKPSKNVTRAEIAVIISNLIRNEEEIDNSLEFLDVKKDNWAYESVNYLRSKAILEKASSSYSVKDTMSRGELAKVLVMSYNLSFDEDNKKKIKLTDIESSPYKEYIQIMVSNEYMSGYPDYTFKDKEGVTRAQLASIINKISSRPNDIEDVKNMSVNLFIPKDISSKHWAYADILSAVNTLVEKEDINQEENLKNEQIQKTDDKINEKIDYKNLQDGRYNVNIEFLKAQGEQIPNLPSMASKSIDKKATLEVKDKKAKIYIKIKPMDISGTKGNLLNAWYYEDKQQYIKSLSSDDIKLKSVDILQDYVHLGEKTKVDNQKTMAFPVKIGEEFTYIKVEVDIMKEIGDISPDASIRIDWNSLSK